MDLAKAGRRIAMVERVPEMIGGTCINLACIPAETLIRSAEVAGLARRAPRFGVAATVGEIAAPKLRERTESVVHAMRAMNLEQFRAGGGLDASGVQLDERGFARVDEHLRTRGT
jgi:probable pyridine nucleotide-disulfide oxidoreductase